MTNRRVLKGFLLDENDVGAGDSSNVQTLDELQDLATDFLAEEIGLPDFPQTNVLGIASERFDLSMVDPHLAGGRYIRGGKPWNASIVHACKELHYVDAEVMSRYLVDEDVDAITQFLKDSLETDVEAERYVEAGYKVTAIENLAESGLPGFQCSSRFSRGGGAGLFDLRSKAYPRGTRIFIETETVWW